MFDDAINAQLEGRTVVFAFLVHADFKSQSMRFWTGVGERQLGGEVWQGVGAIAEISDITRLENGQADPFKVKAASTPEVMSSALIEFEEEASDRPLKVHMQFFDLSEDTPLGAPWLLRDGIMRGASLEVDEEAMSVSVACDTLTSNRGRPAYGMFTDRDQKSRYPQDRGLEFVGGLNGKTIVWPDF